MNSNSKFHENENEKSSPQMFEGCSITILQAKINHQIKGYQLRLFCAKEEFSSLSGIQPIELDDYSYMPDIRERKKVLMSEIEFCKNQILAYQNGDNKAKIIPDRLL